MSHPMGRVFVHCFELQLRDCGGAREKPENLEKNLRIKATNQQQNQPNYNTNNNIVGGSMAEWFRVLVL